MTTDARNYIAAFILDDTDVGTDFEVAVIVADDEGNLTDEYALDPTPVPPHETANKQAYGAFERVLKAHGWQVTGRWSPALNAMYAPAVRLTS
jgi:hypothetical protein